MALKSNVTSGSLTTADGGLSWSDISITILIKFMYVLEAAAILVVTYFLIRYIKKYFVKAETTYEHQKTALNLLERITVGFTLIVGITLALKTVGLDMTLLVSVGLLGLSYGLKDIIKNYIAGILIFLKSPFKIGDIVKIKKYTGRVDKMEFQATTLKTFDHRDVTIYNSDIMVQSIENYSRYPMRRMEINVRLGYGSDTDKALKIFERILAGEPAVLKNPKYRIVFKSFTDSGVTIQLKFWVPMPSDMLQIRTSVAMQLSKALNEDDLFSPYTRDYQAENDFSLNDKRKEKIKQFYSNPLFADLSQPLNIVIDPNNPQAVPELIDADEPTIEDDL